MRPQWKRPLGALAGMALVLGGGTVLAAGTAEASTGAVYVSPTGSSSNSGGSCGSAGYSDINAAIAAAPTGSTVRVCAGTYQEAVVVPKQVKLVGNHAVIDAMGAVDSNGVPAPGVVIAAPGVVFEGFTVMNSTGEGILAVTIPGGPTVSGVLITHNTVTHNDLGGPTSAYLQCRPVGEIPGDCGEGVHLMGVTDSWVLHNNVWGNSGGILLTDETGPNHGNLVGWNHVHGNAADCGITLPAHVPGNGVYDNVVRGNVVNNNGRLGEGAGVLIAAAGPNMAAYDNLVTGNVLYGNGLSGVTIHAHAPGQNVSGNRIIANWIGRNNLNGDPDASNMNTTGVLVFSAVVPVQTVVRDNVLAHNRYGVWLSGNVVANNVVHANRFRDIGQKLFLGP